MSRSQKHHSNHSPRPVFHSIHAQRLVDTSDLELRSFIDSMGQSLAGKGRTYSLGSMTLTLLEAKSFNTALKQISAADRTRLDIQELRHDIEARLRNKDNEPRICIEGVALYGKAIRNRVGNFARLGFKVTPHDHVWEGDQKVIAAVFSDHDLPIPEVNDDPHITFGDVYLNRLVRGSGENPNLLIPRRAYIPGDIALKGVSAEVV